jgi:hypothetical protein
VPTPKLHSLLPLCLLLLAGAAGADMGDYRFRVLLDDRPIGSHVFRVRDDEAGRAVAIEADFDVRVLFVPVYRYRHRNVERWEGGCLVSLRSETDDNGRDLAVRTERGDGHLRVSGADGERELEGCVRSFAYWDPAFLDASQLLNSQDGALVPVRIDALGADAFEVGGTTLEAERWRLTGPGALDISLWYTPEGRWLGLETVREGRVIRYEPETPPALAQALSEAPTAR